MFIEVLFIIANTWKQCDVGNNIQTMEYYLLLKRNEGFPGSSVVKNPPAMQEMQRSIPGSGRSYGEGNGNPLQYTCLENSMDRGAWWVTVHGVIKEWRYDLGNEQQQQRNELSSH